MNTLLGHLAYKLLNAPVIRYPFPHIYIPEIFPPDAYQALLTNLPPEGDYTVGSAYFNGRKFAETTDLNIATDLNSPEFARIACAPFVPYIQDRFKGLEFAVAHDLRLVRDRQNYAIGPHTDAPKKILSFLFYLPSDDSLKEYGTSIYLPNDPSFRCPGGPHHKFNRFTRIYTAPFLPNSLFAFFKTDYSFHGVEPITIPCQRDVLLWNLYDTVKRNGKVQATP